MKQVFKLNDLIIHIVKGLLAFVQIFINAVCEFMHLFGHFIFHVLDGFVKRFKSFILVIYLFLEVNKFQFMGFEFVSDVGELMVNIVEFVLDVFFQLDKLFLNCIYMLINIWNLFKTV